MMEKVRKNYKLIVFGLIIVLIFVLNQKYGWSDYLSNTDT